MRSTTERGYGSPHQRTRATYQAAIDSGTTYRCACDRDACPHHTGQCSTLIAVGSDWDLGHTDDRTAYTGPECVPCNRSAGGRNGRRKQIEQGKTIIREW